MERLMTKKNIRLRYRAEKLLMEGTTIERMADRLGISKDTFYRWHTENTTHGLLPPVDNHCLYCHKTSADAVTRWINDGNIEKAGLR